MLRAPVTEAPLTPIEIGLTAAIVTVEGEEPAILVAGEAATGETRAGLPFGIRDYQHPGKLVAGAVHTTASVAPADDGDELAGLLVVIGCDELGERLLRGAAA